jgi:aconitate hydratase
MFRERYADVFEGDRLWQTMDTPGGALFHWDSQSTYVRNPPYFDGMPPEPPPMRDIVDARVLVMVGDSVTTDHISPAGNIAAESPAARYLRQNEVERADFNSYGSRRGNHEVMARGTFANIRVRNQLVPGTEGGLTRHLPDGEQMSIFDAAERYAAERVPLIVLAGKEYGTGSSRDWAAKGPRLLGIEAAIAESYERIHRSNLVGMGILPLEYPEGQNRQSLGLTGEESYSISGIGDGLKPRGTVRVTATAADGTKKDFTARVRIDTPVELDYYQHGGILQFVLRNLIAGGGAA